MRGVGRAACSCNYADAPANRAFVTSGLAAHSHISNRSVPGCYV
jgi:hypothetical protein